MTIELPPELALRAGLIGSGATLLLDAWNAALRRWFGIPSLDPALLGRWFGHMARGRFRHERIAAAAPIPGERAVGWLAHYAIGIGWAVVLLLIWGLDWARHPTLPPALAVGLATLVAPFFIMQPGMGNGVLASRTARPGAARLKSVASHTVYGIGLYVAAALLAAATNLIEP